MPNINLSLTEDQAIAVRTALVTKRSYAVPEDLEAAIDILEDAMEGNAEKPKKEEIQHWSDWWDASTARPKQNQQAIEAATNA